MRLAATLLLLSASVAHADPLVLQWSNRDQAWELEEVPGDIVPWKEPNSPFHNSTATNWSVSTNTDSGVSVAWMGGWPTGYDDIVITGCWTGGTAPTTNWIAK